MIAANLEPCTDRTDARNDVGTDRPGTDRPGHDRPLVPGGFARTSLALSIALSLGLSLGACGEGSGPYSEAGGHGATGNESAELSASNAGQERAPVENASGTEAPAPSLGAASGATDVVDEQDDSTAEGGAFTVIPDPVFVPRPDESKAPATVAALTPDAASDTASEPAAEAAPAPSPEAEPEPAFGTAPESVPYAAPENAPDVAPQPAPDVAPDAKLEPASEPAPGAASESPPDTVPEPVPDTASKPVPDAPLGDALESAPDDAPPPDPAPGTDAATVDSGADETPAPSTRGKQYKSVTTDGFEGVVQEDGSILVSWTADPTARGYNVYRQAKYLTTVFGTEYRDEKVFDGDYYYEIRAFVGEVESSVTATGLTVKVRGTGRENPRAPSTNEGLLDDYELVFSDEFRGDSLDYDKWNTKFLWPSSLIINSEEQYYVDTRNQRNFGFDPFTFDGEHLTITSVPTPNHLLNAAYDQPYLSGMIASHGLFEFTYGYVETRARMTHGRGLWPAFWLLNASYGGDDPEIDIMEHIGDDQDVVYHTYHYYDDGKLKSTKSHPVPGIDFTADFHTFGVDWRPGLLVFYVDGVETKRIRNPRVSGQDMYLIANTALGGWWAGSPDETTPFPAEYTIDYIRVYEKRTPYDDAPLYDDGTSDAIRPADETPGASPNHRPPYSAWPIGLPPR